VLNDPLIPIRAVHFAAVALVVGALTFRFWIAAPAIQSIRASRPARQTLLRFLWLTFWIGLAFAIVSGVAWLGMLAAQISGLPFVSVWSSGVVITVLTQTQFGQVWQVRMGLVLALAVSLLLPQSAIGATSHARAVPITLALSLVGTLAWAGHSGATEGLPGGVHVAADALHLVAAGTWLGALEPLVVLFASALREGDEAWVSAVHRTTRRFSMVGVACVAILIVTGLVSSWFLVGSTQALTDTVYGRLLAVKVALFAAMVVFAAVNRLRLTPRLATIESDRRTRALGQLAFNSLAEFVLGLGILALVAALGTLPPAAHDRHAMHIHAAAEH
jgi:putative copper resistance protein D